MPRSKQEAQKRKKRVFIQKEAPLPIPITSSGDTSRAGEWFYYTGYIQGSTVVVRHSGDMDFLYKMGFFGKGTVSRSQPNFDERRQKVNLRVPEGDHTQTIQCAVMSKRNFLAHGRYRALADGNGDELSDVIRYEEKQHDLAESSEESDEEYTDDENAPEEEHSIGRIQAFKLLNSHNATQGGIESERITSGDVPQLDLLDQAYMSRYIKPYLVSMLAEVSVLSNEQITSFLQVPQNLAELEDKYCMLRRAELNMLKQMYAVQFPGRNFKRGEVITLDEDENARSHGGIENAADDAVVILDSDDESSEEETGSSSEHIAPVKKRKVLTQGDDNGEDDEKVTQKRKETDWDADDPGDEEFWGDVTSKTGESTQGQKDIKKTDCDPAVSSESAQRMTDQQKLNDGGNQQNKDKKTNDVTEEMEGIINGKADSLKSELAHTKSLGRPNVFQSEKDQLKGMDGKEPEFASGIGKSEEHSDTAQEEDSRFSLRVSGTINPVFERNGGQADNKKKSLDSREDDDVEPDSSERKQPSAEDKYWIKSLSTTTKMDTSDSTPSNVFSTSKLGQLSESARSDSESTTFKSLSFVVGKSDESEMVKESEVQSRGENIAESEQGLANFLQAKSPIADDSNDSDDVICIESKSAEPETLHSFLSQSKKSSSGKTVVTKSVTFMSNITSQPTFVTASVGFSSWDPVVHFNFTGDPSHLPTAMSVPSLSPEHASSSAGSSDKKPAVYERVYPPIRSLIPNPNSQGAVIKQRVKGLPCLSSAYFKITAQSSASSNQSYNKKHRTASIDFISTSTPYKRQTGLNTSSSSSSSSASSSSLTKGVSSSSHLVMPLAPSAVAPHEVSLSHLAHYLKAFHIPPTVGPSEPTSLSTPTDRISPFHTSSHSNTSAKLASLSEILEALRQLHDSSMSRHRSSDGEAEVEDVGLLDTLMLNLHVTLSQYLSYAEISTAMELELLKMILSKRDIPAGDLDDKICDVKNNLSPFHCWILRKRLDHVEERQQLLSGLCDGGADEMVVDLTDNVPRTDQEGFVERNKLNKDDGQTSKSTRVTDTESTETVTTSATKTVEHSRDTEGDRELISEEVAGRKRKIEEGNEASGKKRKYVTAANEVEMDSTPGNSEQTFSAPVNSESDSGLQHSGDTISNGQSGHVTTSSQSTGQSHLPAIMTKDEEIALFKDSGVVGHSDPSPDSCERSSVRSAQVSEGQVSHSGNADNRTAHVTGDNSKESSVPQDSEEILAAQDKSSEQKLLPSSSQPQDSTLSATSLEDKSVSGKDAEKSGSASIQAGCSEENQICIGSSSEDDDETTSGWNVGVYSGQASSQRQFATGRGKFHPYSAEDEVGGDMFVVANTSDDDAEDVVDDANVIRKSKSQRWRPCLKTDPWPVQEKLHLMLEEAFFLSYGLGCLRVEDDEKKPLDLSQMWQQFQALNEQFIPHYVAYHYFRSQGWVPKSGLKFGCDLILYREGPPFYHGSYSVVVTTVSDSSLMPLGSPGSDLCQRQLSWISLSGLNRITEHVAKELMVCYVLWPSSVSEEELKSPNCISKFTVKEVVVSRWVSSQKRQNKTEDEEIP